MPDGAPAAQTLPNRSANAADPALANAPPRSAPAPLSTFGDAVKHAVTSLVQLRVTTIVGTASAQFAGDLAEVTAIGVQPEGQAVACTTINTALGDCTLIQSPVFITDTTYKTLHEDAVKSALAIRRDTMNLLKEAWTTFEGLLKT